MKRKLTVNVGCSVEFKDAVRTLIRTLAETDKLTIVAEPTGSNADMYYLTVDEELSEALDTFSDTGIYSYEEVGEK